MDDGLPIVEAISSDSIGTARNRAALARQNSNAWR
jgi:hypothetical protein